MHTVYKLNPLVSRRFCKWPNSKYSGKADKARVDDNYVNRPIGIPAVV